MRTGAIFARGSCRALKWMALLGMVLALGAGQAAAQATELNNAMLTIDAADPEEGGSPTTITVTLSAEVPAQTTGETTVTITLAATARNTGDGTPAEPTDWALSEADSAPGNGPVNLELKFPENDSSNSRRSVAFTTATLQTGTTDTDAEDEDLTLTATPPGIVYSDNGTTALPATNENITIIDAQPQTYALERTVPTGDPMEGESPITVTVTAMPAHVQGSAVLRFILDKPELGYQIGTITGGSSVTANGVTIGSTDGATAATDEQNTATIPLSTTVTNDMNRVDDTLTLSAFSGVGREAETTLPIVLTDKNMLPALTATLTDANGMAVTNNMVTEGMDYVLTFTTEEAATEDLTVMLDTSGSTASAQDDYSLGKLSGITIAMGATSSEEVSLAVDSNADLEENERLMLSATVNGDDATYGPPQPGLNPTGMLSLTIVDTTPKLVWAKTETAIESAIATAKAAANGGNNPGDDFSLAGTALFDTAPGYSASYVASSSDRAKVSVSSDGATIMVMPEAAGSAMITVTATAQAMSTVTRSPQTEPNVAEIMFEAVVVDAPLQVPGVPVGFEAIPGDMHVLLRWEAPTSGGEATGYEYDQNASGTWTDVGMVTSFPVTELTNGTSYLFQVRAYNAAGAGASTAGKSAIPVPREITDPVTIKAVKAATSVDESAGLEVTVDVTVPAGTKGTDGKVAPIASKRVMVSFPTTDIVAAEKAEASDTTLLGASSGAYTWTNITRTEKESVQSYKFRVAIGQDLDAEDEKFFVEVMIDGASMKSKVITIDDTEEQKYELSLPTGAKGAIKEGAAAVKLTLEAIPAKTFNIAVLLELDPNDPSKYTLGGPTRDLFGISPFETTIAAKADGDRVDDTITVTAYTEREGELASLDITVTDANALPRVKATIVDDKGKAEDPQPESVMEGETVKVMLTAIDKDDKAMKAAEKLTITLMPTGSADAQDYRLSSQSIEIPKDKESSAAVDLMITEDQDIGEETLTFDAAVAGEAKNGTDKKSVAGVLSLMIMDGTQKLVWANSQEEVEAAVYAAKEAGAGDDMTFTAGEMIEVMGALLFSSAEGVSVSYTASSSMSDVAMASVSGGTVMVTAMAEGMADITITAHGSMSSGVKRLDQNDPGMASIMFMVEVGLEALSITLKGPDNMDLVEGMSAEVTATANRAVTADTKVMLMRDRAMSSAGDDDYMADPITITAGEMTGSTMVMAIEDNMMEDMEELVLYGMTEGMAGEVTGEVHLHLWDAAVPALPVIAQLLLAAFLAVGGYRRYRRR